MYLFLSLGEAFVKLFFILYLVVYSEGLAEGRLLAEIYTYLILLPIYLVIIFRICSFKFNSPIIYNSLKYSLPLIPATLGGWLINRSNRIYIENFLSLEQVGIFTLSFSICSALYLLSQSFHSAYAPYFFEKFNSKNDKEKESLGQYHLLYILLLLLPLQIVVFFSKDLVIFFGGEDYLSSAIIMPLICTGMCISNFSSILRLSIHQEKETKKILKSNLAGAFFSVPLNILFIPSFGIEGAAYSLILCQMVIFLYSYYLVSKEALVSIPYKGISFFIFGFSLTIIFSPLFVIINHNIFSKSFLFILSLIFIFKFLIQNISIQTLNFHEIRNSK